MTLQQIITQVKTEGGFDVTDATVKAWALDRYQRLVAESQWRREEISLGPTVAGQVRYSLPDTVVDVRALKVDDSRYQRVSIEELWDVKASLMAAVGGIFAPGYDATETAEYVEIYPVPTEAGDAITALVAVIPAAITETQEPRIPRDFDHVIVEGAIADGLGMLEGRVAEADRWEAMFRDGVEKLRRRRNSRVGSGPVRIRVGR